MICSIAWHVLTRNYQQGDIFQWLQRLKKKSSGHQAEIKRKQQIRGGNNRVASDFSMATFHARRKWTMSMIFLRKESMTPNFKPKLLIKNRGERQTFLNSCHPRDKPVTKRQAVCL